MENYSEFCFVVVVFSDSLEITPTGDIGHWASMDEGFY